MVAQRHHVGAAVQNGLCLPGQKADAGGVFAVYHGKMDAKFPLEPGQAALQKVKSGLRDHISHGKYVQFHTRSSKYA